MHRNVMSKKAACGKNCNSVFSMYIYFFMSKSLIGRQLKRTQTILISYHSLYKNTEKHSLEL